MVKAIFTVIKNEGRYLEEWFNWHIKLGFNKFILYEDTGSISHEPVINKYYKIIDIDYYTDVLNGNEIEPKDIVCFRHIVDNYNGIDWIIKLDPDEYVKLPEGKTIDDILYNVDPVISQITMDWRLYNANGFIDCPYAGVYSLVDTYIADIEKENLDIDFDINVSENEYDWGKTLLRYNNFIKNYKDKFNEVLSINFPYQFYIDNKENIIDGSKEYGMFVDHYITKSFEEYLEKIKTRGDYRKNKRTIGDFFVLNPDMVKDIPDIEQKFKINIFGYDN